MAPESLASPRRARADGRRRRRPGGAGLRRGAALSALVVGVAGFDLDPCSSKPSFAATRCEAGSVVACWSADTAVQWSCWAKEWAPAWALTSSSAAADAECMTRPARMGLIAMPGAFYQGACTLVTPSKADQLVVPEDQRDWGEARQRAESLVKLMNVTEKLALVAGGGWQSYDLAKWWYVGNTAPIPRLGIPSLNMEDSSGGFRTYWTEVVGTVTAWPSLLAMAATWDPAAVRSYAKAVGEEFVGKGANTLLGPSVNVHRVARNGRNFEYLSGEDPFLGSVLARAYVEGAQANDLIAVVKHWIFNEQETNRGTESSNVDLKTAWELYYPPFSAAVGAGVDAAMCSYNRVNGEHACSNADQFRVLKQDMGFQGFVQSDWWASKFGKLGGGLDQDMPGNDLNYTELEDFEAEVNWDAVDESVTRILTAMYRANVMNTTKCAPPNCKEFFLANVSTPLHIALARRLAAESIVLLKNEGGLLPLRYPATRRIAIVGAAASAPAWDPEGVSQNEDEDPNVSSIAWRIGDIYSGGGSGHMVAGRVITALDGLRRRAEAAGIAVVVSATDDPAAGAAAAAGADVAIVVAGATSGEAADRDNLTLSGDADDLITAVAGVNPRTVVAMQIPGAALTPWRADVAAILAMFLGGQETGNSWANVIFGDVMPAGRLPIMMPATENDTIAPGLDLNVPYSEGLATSYRNPKFKAAFPFGHGLTYTTFEYSAPTSFPCEKDLCVEAKVRNNGTAPARTVAQLYLRFPEVSGHPAPFLKGFYKTPVILPGAAVTAHFRLTDRDLSWYDHGAGGFTKTLAGTALIGESSADLRVEHELMETSTRWGPGILGTMLLICAVALMVMALYEFGLFDRSKRQRRRDLGLLATAGNEEGTGSSTE